MTSRSGVGRVSQRKRNEKKKKEREYLNCEGSVGDPRSDKGTRLVRRRTQRRQNSTVLRVGNLGNQQRRRAHDNGVAKAQHKPRRNKHAEILCTRLQANGQNHDATPNQQTDFIAIPVDNVRHGQLANNGPETHGGIEQAQQRTLGVVEKGLPIRKCLQTVHHGAVKAIGRVGGDEHNNKDVEAAHVAAFVPGGARELAVGKEKVALGRFLGRGDHARRGSHMDAHDERKEQEQVKGVNQMKD